MGATERVKKSVRDSIKSTEEFIETMKRTLQNELAKTTPDIEHALDRSLDGAGQALSIALESVETTTTREQIELLNGYRRFLQGQIEFVDNRLKAMKKR